MMERIGEELVVQVGREEGKMKGKKEQRNWMLKIRRYKVKEELKWISGNAKGEVQSSAKYDCNEERKEQKIRAQGRG